MTEWEECQELVEQTFGEKPETPLELVKVMICMADEIVDLQKQLKGETSSQKIHIC